MVALNASGFSDTLFEKTTAVGDCERIFETNDFVNSQWTHFYSHLTSIPHSWCERRRPRIRIRGMEIVRFSSRLDVARIGGENHHQLVGHNVEIDAVYGAHRWELLRKEWQLIGISACPFALVPVKIQVYTNRYRFLCPSPPRTRWNWMRRFVCRYLLRFHRSRRIRGLSRLSRCSAAIEWNRLISINWLSLVLAHRAAV